MKIRWSPGSWSVLLSAAVLTACSSDPSGFLGRSTGAGGGLDFFQPGVGNVGIVVEGGGALFDSNGLGPEGSNFSDFNQDGHPDMIVRNKSNSTVALFQGNGSGKFVEAGSFRVSPANNAFLDFEVGDMNGDGVLDLVVLASYWNLNIRVYFGNGETFSDVNFEEYRIDDKTGVALAVADVDQDGSLEVFATSDRGMVYRFDRDNQGNYSHQSVVAAGDGESIHRLVQIVFMDDDDDGDLDLVVLDKTAGSLITLENRTQGSLSVAHVEFLHDDPEVAKTYNSVQMVQWVGHHLIVVNRANRSLSFLRNREVREEGTLGGAVAWEFSLTSLDGWPKDESKSAPTDLILADVDNSGEDDLVVLAGIGATFCVFADIQRNQGISSGVCYEAPNAGRLAAGGATDVDQDGVIDFGLLDRDQNQVVLGYGSDQGVEFRDVDEETAESFFHYIPWSDPSYNPIVGTAQAQNSINFLTSPVGSQMGHSSGF